MKAETKRRIKAVIERMDAALWVIVRRWAFRQLRKLVDVADDRLQAAQVKLREEIAMRPNTAKAGTVSPSEDASVEAASLGVTPYGEDFQQWEARRSGVAPITKKSARKRHRLTAAEFDRQFA